MAGTVFPAIIRPTYDPSQGFPKLVEDARRTSDDMRRQFEGSFKEIGRLAQQALSIPRNQAGSLDLGVEQYKEAAANARAHATALRELANAAQEARRSNSDTSQATKLYTQAAGAAALAAEKEATEVEQLAAAHEKLQLELNKTKSGTDRVVQAAAAGTTAFGAVTNSQRAMRYASIQAGQQLQDVAISLYSGQRASIVFAQQIPQLAFALTGVEGKVGAVARLFSGPWGIALVGASALLGGLIDKYVLTGDEADKAKPKQYDFARGLDVVALSTKEATNAMQQLGDAIRSTIKVQGDLITSNAQIANQSVADLQKRLAALQEFENSIKAGKGSISPQTRQIITGLYGNNVSGDQITADIASTTSALAQARANAAQARFAVEQRTATESITQGASAIRRIDEQITALNSRRQDALDLENSGDQLWQTRTSKNYISEIDYQKKLAALLKQRNDLQDAARSKGSGLYGREINASEASSIAQAAGFHVTSAQRTIEQQRYLYEHARTAANPVAYPNANAPHVRGNALDIAFGAGVSPESIRKAYADAGVRLTKILKETGHFHIEWSTTGADKAQHEADALAKKTLQLAEFATSAQDKISRIREQFDETPPAVKAVNDNMAALNELSGKVRDQVLQGLDPKVAADFQAQIEALKPVVEDGINKPFREMVKSANERKAVEDAMLQGGQAQAEITQRILDLKKAGTPITQQVLDTTRDIVIAEHQRSLELEKQADAQNRQLQLLDQTKSNISNAFYGLLKGGGLSAIGDAFKAQWDAILRNVADNLTESLFDDFFRSQKDKVLGYDKVNEASTVAAANIATLGDAAIKTAQALANVQPVGGGAAAAWSAGEAAGSGLSASDPLARAFDAIMPITVFGKAANDNAGPPLVEVANTNEIAASLNVFTKPFSATVGDKIEGAFGSVLSAFGLKKGQVQAVFQGAALGQVGGGLVGGAGIGSAIGGVAGQAAANALKNTKFGQSAVGSILTAAIPIIGGVIGGLFKKAKTGSASVSDGNVSIGGNNSDAQASVSGIADQINSDLSKIAQALGGSVGSYAFTVGQRNDEYRVSANSGADVTSKNPSGLLYKGKDAQEAMRVALVNAIQDGAVKGIREGAQRLLQAGKDLQTQIDKALKFNNVFDELQSIKDPLGYAVTQLNKQFEDLISIFKEAGASTEEWGQLQELYDLKRTDIIKQQTAAVKQANDQLVSSLLDLRSQLLTGDSGLSLRDRLANAHAVYDPLAAAISSGQAVDYDKFAQAAKDVIDISRQLYGSQQEYFQTFNEVLGLTDQALALQTAAQTSVDTTNLPGAPSFQTAATDNSSVIAALQALGFTFTGGTDLAALNAQLTAVNANLGTLIQQGLANGTIVPNYALPTGVYF